MLSERLAMILCLIEPCNHLVDIGSDHGYLALAAFQKGLVKDIIATDLRPQPLIQSQKTFAQANVFEHVSYVLSDGLKEVTTSVDCAVIAGMGADLIIKIITQDLDKFKKMSQIITQANTRIPFLRKTLGALGFVMDQEKIVFDGFFYIAQSYHYTGNIYQLNEFNEQYGNILNRQDPITINYLKSEEAKLKLILENNPSSKKHHHLLSLLKRRLDESSD